MELIIVKCMDCKPQKIIGCIVEMSTAVIDTRCGDCEFKNGCKVRASADNFDTSHGICKDCLEIRRLL